MQALFPAEIPWLPADWPLADRFVAGTSMTDNPLVTQGFNLARHVADEPSRVGPHGRGWRRCCRRRAGCG